MSIESAKAFVAKLKTDEGFANQVKAFPNAEERLAFVKESGFDFTPEEIKQVDEELSDNELDAVAGGDHWCENAFCWTFGY
ncbi:Nif11-like leader peptide family natural product precursor [Desulfosporosinus youngiae]|uniref:Bacteriocin propeptide, TIGR03798 family n=1 Tax=Desulfosporosinus youngiae DSM 17734 TaxID=768710 RepID=H5Y3E6_9FIRM|nr:Nif11-like leader peptide family natural product precursor [Desulfosporosinus youngiae]EHQ88915.1 bacteriocin propeptide, TIGR03798 family [Desulfosporosinus youngiae DSM 17734]